MSQGPTPEKIISEMVRRIVEKMHPQKIILFGSRARGTASPDSDVDLLVIFSSQLHKRKMTVEIYKALAGIGLPKDVVVVTEKDIEQYRNTPGTLIQPAIQEGKILYDRAA